ncbi:50S ribosomal protein L22 [candidate division KSB1 bacterium]|nr:50S ribosomal protein L22 [candidate division KSB1 bacterium]
MESRCVTRYVRVTPRKMRLVADLVRGKNVHEAVNLLKFTTRSAAQPTLKAIQSAVANLVNSDEGRDVNPEQLFVKTIFVDEGPTMKRFMPRAMGRAAPIMKRSSHLTVFVATPEAAHDIEAAAVAEAQPKAAPKPSVKAAPKPVVKATTEKKSAAKPAVKKSPAKKS